MTERVSFKYAASGLSNEHLGLILMPTEQCNFRCTYCYEDFLLGRMSKEVIQGIKHLLSERMPELTSLSVEWFGGEPLAAKEIIYELGEYIQQLLYQNPGIQYGGSITTNGFNLRLATFRKLLALGINSFQISLDGPKEFHDRSRLRIDGSGSFDVIWENLLALHHTTDAFKVVLRVHITPENEHSIEFLLEDINDSFGDDERFEIFLKPIENLGGPQSGKFSI